jgi:hypothetical protein
LDPPVLLDQPDQLDLQELTQKYLDPLGHKEQQDHKDLRVIKVTLEIKDRKVKQDHKVFKGYRVSKVKLDPQELTQQYLDPLGRKVKQGHKVFKEYRVSKVRLDPLDHKEILETKVHKVRLDLLDYKEYKVHKELLVEMARKE